MIDHWLEHWEVLQQLFEGFQGIKVAMTTLFLTWARPRWRNKAVCPSKSHCRIQIQLWENKICGHKISMSFPDFICLMSVVLSRHSGAGRGRRNASKNCLLTFQPNLPFPRERTKRNRTTITKSEAFCLFASTRSFLRQPEAFCVNPKLDCLITKLSFKSFQQEFLYNEHFGQGIPLLFYNPPPTSHQSCLSLQWIKKLLCSGLVR
jgi:hypothetical protein